MNLICYYFHPQVAQMIAGRFIFAKRCGGRSTTYIYAYVYYVLSGIAAPGIWRSVHSQNERAKQLKPLSQ